MNLVHGGEVVLSGRRNLLYVQGVVGTGFGVAAWDLLDACNDGGTHPCQARAQPSGARYVTTRMRGVKRDRTLDGRDGEWRAAFQSEVTTPERVRPTVVQSSVSP